MEDLLTGSAFNQVRAFVVVAELLSFTRAAHALDLSPSALSQAIRGLEAHVGAQLFNRTTRRVALTEAGAALLRRARPAVTELTDAIDQLHRHGPIPAGTVRVHAFRSAAMRFIEPILAPFAKAYPQVVLDLTLDDAVVDLVGGGYDVALRLGEVIERDMIAVKLGQDMRQIAVAAPSYLKQHGTPKHPRELTKHRCVRWRWPGQVMPYAWEFYEKGQWFEVAVDGPLVVNDKEMNLRATLAGVGIGFLIDSVVAEPIEKGKLVPLLEKYSAPFPGMYLCYPHQRQMAPALRAFIDAVRDQRAIKRAAG
ncbi:MAG: LysR family transcriptional regulator [Kofleriaceae bacterium]